MAYGTVKVDNIIFDSGGSDQAATVSGLYRATTSGVTVSGTLGAATISGSTVTGTNANFTTVSGSTVTGTTANFTSGNFTTLNTSSIPGFAVLSGTQTFSGGQRGAVNVVSYATGIALDFATSNNFQITLTGNTTLQNPTNVVSGQNGLVTIIQGSSGNTMAFGANWNYPGGSGSIPSLTATSGAKDLLAYYSISATQIAYRLIQDIKA